MIHDWRKVKSFLSDYLTSAKISQDCGDIIRQNHLLKEILGSREKDTKPRMALVPELHSYLTKMMQTQPQVKLQVVEAMMNILNQYKPTG
jgi:hypothetical protein